MFFGWLIKNVFVKWLLFIRFVNMLCNLGFTCVCVSTTVSAEVWVQVVKTKMESVMYPYSVLKRYVSM